VVLARNKAKQNKANKEKKKKQAGIIRCGALLVPLLQDNSRLCLCKVFTFFVL
jgi:hypothetical protein